MKKLFTTIMFVLAGLFAHAQSTFSLDASRIFQTIDSREDTPQAAQNEATNANNLITPIN